MKKMNFLLGLFFLLGAAAPVFGQNYPSRTIRWVIPYAAGGGSDMLARAFQGPLEKALGAKVIVENIPAGTTKVGVMEVAKAKPDGYTILSPVSEGLVAYYYSGTFETKIWQTLTPIGNLTVEPYGFVEVRAESAIKTWGDLVKAGKASPGRLTCGGPGAGGMMEIIMNEVTKAGGFATKYVPFQGGGPGKIALLGGHIDFRICTPAEAYSSISGGRSRGLAVSAGKRMKLLPEVPIFRELGIGGEIPLFRGIWGPPNLPPDLVTIISKAIEKGVKDPEFIKIAETQLLATVDYRPGGAMMEALESYDKTWGKKLADSYK